MNTQHIVLGGPEAKLVRRKGDICYSIEYVNREESLCFWRANRAVGNGAFILGVHSLGRYFDGVTGLPTQAGVDSCRFACKVMGFSEFDSFAFRRLLDALYIAIDDLIKTRPPEPIAMDLTGVEKLEVRADGDLIFKHKQ